MKSSPRIPSRLKPVPGLLAASLVCCCALAIHGQQLREPEMKRAEARLAPRPPAQRSATALAARHVKAIRLRLPDTAPRPKRSDPPGRDPDCEECTKTGYVQPVPRDYLREAEWVRLPDGSHALKIELESSNATGLRIQFAGELPRGVTYRTYDTAGAVFGPFNPPAVDHELAPPLARGERTWWTPTVFGEVAGLEFYIPAGQSPPGRLPQIVQVAFLYPDEAGISADGMSGSELPCHLDVTCFPAFANEASAVARMSFVKGSSTFGCTGALLNRAPSDFAPIFLTAAHCISRQETADTLELFWLFQRASCDTGMVPSLSSLPRTRGALVLKVHIDADECLLGLFEPPPVNFYLGWDAGNTASWQNGDAAIAIHHPAGTHKRISFGIKIGDNSAPFDLDTGFFPWIHYWDIRFDTGQGTVEKGSSGSPILDGQRRVRGTLTGGGFSNECPPLTRAWGRLEYAWSNLKYYLDNMASPTFVDRAVSGDNNNDGDNERGTSGKPFNTLREATYCVRAGDEIRIAPGNYNEQFKIWRPMTLTANGGNVRIGPP